MARWYPGRQRDRGAQVYNLAAYGGILDGAADCSAAMTAVLAAMPARGGEILVPGVAFFAAPVTIDKPIVLSGNGAGIDAGTHPSELRFAAGINGLVLTASAKKPVVRDIAIVSASSGAGAGHGIWNKATRAAFVDIVVDGFGDHGVFWDTIADGNVNVSRGEGVRSVNNGGDGFHIEGSDSNVVSLYSCDGTTNVGYGFANYSAHNTFAGCHASGNTAGDYYEKGSSGVWINPYAESGGTFDIDTAGADNGELRTVGPFGAPTIRTGNPPAAGIAAAVAAGWDVTDKGVKIGRIRLKDGNPLAAGNEWRIIAGSAAIDEFSIEHASGVRVLRFNAGGTVLTLPDPLDIATGTVTGTKLPRLATQKLALWGAPPVVQPVANPNTSGATLAQVETEVNELKALLRLIGAMAT